MNECCDQVFDGRFFSTTVTLQSLSHLVAVDGFVVHQQDELVRHAGLRD